MKNKHLKPRNFVIKALANLGLKSGVHEKSNKARRRKEKVKLLADLE